MNGFDDWQNEDAHDWEAELRANEDQLQKECELRLSLERARDAGHERLAGCLEQLLAAIAGD